MARNITCRDCRVEFEAPVRRGRPPVRCEGCQSKTQVVVAGGSGSSAAERLAKARAAKAAEVVLATDTTPSRGHHPRGIEAQCTRCHRLFSSDSVCEKHKYYAAPKSKDCKDPVELGFVAVEKRGLPVWTKGE